MNRSIAPTDLSIASADGLALRGVRWSVESPVAVLVVGHGLGEHSGLYDHLAPALNASLPIDVLAFDFRGHGRSPGKRGHVDDATQFIDDWQGTLRFAGLRAEGRPIFALGHSYGGLSAMMAAVAGRLPCSGLIVSNPALRMRMAVPGMKVAIGRLLRVLAPTVTLSATLPIEHLTRDPAMRQRRRDDHLSHDRISAPLYFGMREGAERVLASAERFATPLLMILGEADPVVDPDASRTWFESCGSTDKTIRIYPDRAHEPLADLGREKVFGDIVDWLAPRSE